MNIVAGGATESWTSIESCEVYYDGSQEWITIKALPMKIQKLKGIQFKDEFYVIGRGNFLKFYICKKIFRAQRLPKVRESGRTIWAIFLSPRTFS